MIYRLKNHLHVHNATNGKIRKQIECNEHFQFKIFYHFRYTSTKSLENHIQFVHKKEPKAGDMCEFCGKRFISRTSVINHIQTVHRSEAGSGNQIVSIHYKNHTIIIQLE